MRTASAILGFLMVTLAAECAPTPQSRDFVGTYEGGSLGKNTTGRSFILQLDISVEKEAYSLSAEMNDTNREEGMDHTSNSHWNWTGLGGIHDGILVFTFNSPEGGQRNGSIRRERAGLTLKLDGVRYRIRPSKPD